MARAIRMTPGEQRWLEKLLEGPQVRPRYGALPVVQCIRNGWSEAFWRDAETGQDLTMKEAIERKMVGTILMDRITNKGRAALEDERVKVGGG